MHCAVTMAESELVSFDFEIFGIVQGIKAVFSDFTLFIFIVNLNDRIISAPLVARHCSPSKLKPRGVLDLYSKEEMADVCTCISRH